MAVFHFAPVWTASRFASSGKKRRGIKDVAGAALQGAQIVLQPTATTAVSDAQGSFVIPNVKPGAYAVKVSYVGFTNSVTSVVLNSGQATPVNATMSVASANQQAEVTADLVGDAAAINEQRTSANILKRADRYADPEPAEPERCRRYWAYARRNAAAQ